MLDGTHGSNWWPSRAFWSRYPTLIHLSHRERLDGQAWHLLRASRHSRAFYKLHRISVKVEKAWRKSEIPTDTSMPASERMSKVGPFKPSISVSLFLKSFGCAESYELQIRSLTREPSWCLYKSSDRRFPLIMLTEVPLFGRWGKSWYGRMFKKFRSEWRVTLWELI